VKVEHPIITDGSSANIDIIALFSFQDSGDCEDLDEIIRGKRFSSLGKTKLFYLKYDANWAKQIANVLVIYKIPLLEDCHFYSIIIIHLDEEIKFDPERKIITIKGKITQNNGTFPREINTIRMQLEERFFELQEEILKIGRIVEGVFTIHGVNNKKIDFEWQESGYQILNLVGSDSFSTIDN
jgi:hypothetical protein